MDSRLRSPPTANAAKVRLETGVPQACGMVRVYRETGRSEGDLIRSDEDLVDYTSADVREPLVAPFMQVGEPILI